MKLFIPILLLVFSGPALSKNSEVHLVCEFDAGGEVEILIHDEYLNPFLGIPWVTVNTATEGFQGYAYVSVESYTVAIPKNAGNGIKDVSHTLSIDRKNGGFMFLEYQPYPDPPKRRHGICKRAPEDTHWPVYPIEDD